MLTKDTKLRFWCQQVLPLVYDDSLSYYELLNKVVLHLNKHTEDINALIDFYDTFAEDVEEIIRQMMDDGDFNEIVADTLGSIVAKEYDPDETYILFSYCIFESKLYRANDSTTGVFDPEKWDERTVGYDLTTIQNYIYSLDAGNVAFDSTETYSDETVGKELKDLNNAITALVGKTITYDRKDLATSDISTPVEQGVYVWYISSATPDNFGTGGVILVIAFASWLIAQLGYGNNGKMYFRQYNTGAWSAWKTVNTNTAPIVPPPTLINSDIVKVDTPLLDGTLKSYTVEQDGWYQVRAYNAAVETELEVAFCDSTQSYIYSNNYRPANTGVYAKCVSSWLYYNAGETIYYYLIGQNATFCGLYYSPVQQ